MKYGPKNKFDFNTSEVHAVYVPNVYEGHIEFVHHMNNPVCGVQCMLEQLLQKGLNRLTAFLPCSAPAILEAQTFWIGEKKKKKSPYHPLPRCTLHKMHSDPILSAVKPWKDRKISSKWTEVFFFLWRLHRRVCEEGGHWGGQGAVG